MKCSSCGKQKNSLTPRTSALVNTMTLFMCKECVDNGYEPRWLIIMQARSAGLQTVREFLKHERYDGAIITAREIA